MDSDLVLSYPVFATCLSIVTQVATIHEILGNGSQAESFLQLGKNISSFQGLPVFLVSFSIALGMQLEYIYVRSLVVTSIEISYLL